MLRGSARPGALAVLFLACGGVPPTVDSGDGTTVMDATETSGSSGAPQPTTTSASSTTSASEGGSESTGCPVPGDPCGAWCEAAMELMWCLEDFPLPGGLGDRAAVAVDPAGNIAIAVYFLPHKWGWRTALFSVSPDGELRWSQSSAHGFRLRDLAALADGSVVLAGQQEGEAVLLVFGSDGAALHERRRFGVAGYQGALGSFADGGFIAAEAEAGGIARIERLTRDLTVEWEHTVTDEAPGDVWAQQIAVSPCGTVAVGLGMPGGEMALVFTPDGEVVRQVVSADSPDVGLSLVAFGAGDRIVFTGGSVQVEGVWGRHVARLDPWAGTWSPLEFHSDPFGTGLLNVVVVPTATGEDLVWASHGGDSYNYDVFLQRKAAGGVTPWGLFNIADPEATYVLGADLARSDGDATLVVGGAYHENDSAAWLCKLRP